MTILSSSALRISSLVSAKIGEKEESDLSAKIALIRVRKNCEPIAIYGSLQDFMHGRNLEGNHRWESQKSERKDRGSGVKEDTGNTRKTPNTGKGDKSTTEEMKRDTA